MQLIGAIKLWMPLAGLATFLAFAPQSRAQAEVSPDQFGDNGTTSSFAHGKAPAAEVKAAPAAVAQKRKPAKRETVSAKKPSSPQQNELVAVNDKSKVPARKPDNQ